jgi:hypothetical protein
MTRQRPGRDQAEREREREREKETGGKSGLAAWEKKRCRAM